MTIASAQQIAETISIEGFETFEAELEQLLADAQRRNVSPVLVGVAADHATPVPVRERALGRVVVELCRDEPQPALPQWVTSGIRTHRIRSVHAAFRNAAA